MTSPAAPTAPALPSPTGAVRLADWGVIRAQGADAAKFLHGQLTQDVEHLSPGQARLAGYCSAKGRLLASFVLWHAGPDELMLACSADLLAPTLKRLQMFVLRAACRLSDASADTALWGLAGDTATAWLGAAAPPAVWDSRGLAHPAESSAATTTAPATAPTTAPITAPVACVIRLPDAQAGPAAAPGPAAGLVRYLLAQPAAAAAPALPALAADDWAWLEVASGVPRIVAATVERFVPQMVNLELVGGVNFQKGCYPGQEVVARSQYRGTLKRRAVRLLAEAPLAPGQEVFHSADPGQPAGQVALAAQGPSGACSALVEVKLSALEGGSLHAGRADGPVLRRAGLPYALPAEA